MFTFKKTLLLLILFSALSACEPKPEPKVSQTALSPEQQMLILQQLQLQQQVYTQMFNSLQAHEQQVDQQLRRFSATQACAIAGNCRVETQIIPK